MILFESVFGSSQNPIFHIRSIYFARVNGSESEFVYQNYFSTPTRKNLSDLGRVRVQTQPVDTPKYKYCQRCNHAWHQIN